MDRETSRVSMIGAAVLLALAGMIVHNMADLPLQLLSPENTLPGLLWLILFVLWLVVRRARWAAALLLAWGCINLIGAVVTVLPLSVLPFEPEQSLRHYAFHILYTATQLPLLLIAWRQVRPRADRHALIT